MFIATAADIGSVFVAISRISARSSTTPIANERRT